MARYIDADTLLKKFLPYTKECGEVVLSPTADVVEVVRCKNCKYKSDGNSKFGVYYYCTHPEIGLTNIKNEHHFCSYGEK